MFYMKTFATKFRPLHLAPLTRGTIAASALAAIATALLVQGASATLARTPDQQLVAGFKTARAASWTTLSNISSVPSTEAKKKAVSELSRAIEGIDAANNAAPSAVGALETSSVRTALRQGTALSRQARSDVGRGRYAAARVKLRRADALISAALSDFGVPLEKDFRSSVTTRKNVSPTGAFVYGQGGHTGISAVVGSDIVEVVIGAADRRTANAGEPGATSRTSEGLPITDIGPAFFEDEAGNFTSQWCTLTSGLITCRIRGAMPADLTFLIAFEPTLPKGTKLLVKFRSPSGDRSYALPITR